MRLRRRSVGLGLLALSAMGVGAAWAGPAQQTSITVGPSPMGMSVRGDRLVVALESGSVALVDTQGNETIAVYGVGPRPIDATIVGRRVYVLHHDGERGQRGRVTMLDAADGRLVESTPVGRGPAAIAVDPRAERVYVVNFKSRNVSVLDARSLETRGVVGGKVWRAPTHGYPTDVEIDRGLNMAFVSTTDGYLEAVEGLRLVDGARVQKVVGDTALEVDELRHQVYMTNGADGRVTQVNATRDGLGRPRTWTVDDLQAERVAVSRHSGLMSVLGIPIPDEDPVDEVVVLDRRTHEEIGRATVGFGTWDMQPAPDAWHFYLSAALGHEVLLVGADGAPPQTEIDVAEPAVLERGEPLAGITTDDWSGVTSVTVWFEHPSRTWSAQARLDCETPRRCSWNAPAPDEPGTYTVRMEARDKAGNVEAEGEGRSITWTP